MIWFNSSINHLYSTLLYWIMSLEYIFLLLFPYNNYIFNHPGNVECTSFDQECDWTRSPKASHRSLTVQFVKIWLHYTGAKSLCKISESVLLQLNTSTASGSWSPFPGPFHFCTKTHMASFHVESWKFANIFFKLSLLPYAPVLWDAGPITHNNILTERKTRRH